MSNVTAIMAISMEIPQQIKNRIPIWFSDPTSGHIARKLKTRSQRGICTPTFITALIHNSQEAETTKCPMMNGWKKESVVHVCDRILFSP